MDEQTTTRDPEVEAPAVGVPDQPPAPDPVPSGRTYTAQEAARIAGLSVKAIKGRLDRSAQNPESPTSLRYVIRDGRRRIPHSELERVGLIAHGAEPVSGDQPARRATDRASQVASVVDAGVLVARIEQLAADLTRARLLTEQAGSGRAELEAELHRARAEAAEAQARAEAAEARAAELEDRPGWWRRTFGS
jgi:hypothetical protein